MDIENCDFSHIQYVTFFDDLSPKGKSWVDYKVYDV